MKNLRALCLALVMMVSGNVFAAEPVPAGGASSGDVSNQPEQAPCPCGKNADTTCKKCETPEVTRSGSMFDSSYISLGVAVAGIVALVASGSGSTPSHSP
jgi:hypothetical protein